jgi:SSS family solute:Na+ symporter
MGRLVAELNKDGITGWVLYFAEVNFLHFCIFLFAVSVALVVVGSLLTPAPSEEKLDGLTYATTVAADKASSRASWGTADVVHSVIVVAIVLAVLIYFSPLRTYIP